MSKVTDITQEVAARRIADALQLRVGRGRRHSFAALADATDIPQRTLESYVQGATPGFHNFLRLCAVLGPSFTTDTLSLAGQSAQEASADTPEHMKAVSAMGSLTSMIGEALADDGCIDHREAAAMRPAAQALMQVIQPIAHPPESVEIREWVS